MLKIDSQTQKSILSQSHKLNARIIDRHDLTKDLAILKILPLKGDIPVFTAGQFINLGIVTGEKSSDIDVISSFSTDTSRIIRRAYSVVSSPREDFIEFIIDLVPHGNVTPVLWQLDAGDKVWMEPKARGRFTLDKIPDSNDLLMIRNGTGVAPFVSMLRRYKNSGKWNRFILVHGSKTTDNLAYFTELKTIERDDPTVTYYPLLSREPAGSGWEGRRGRVQELFYEKETKQNLLNSLDPDKTDVFLCGNSEMIESMKTLLEPYGYKTGTRANPGNVHTEKYW